MIAAALCIMSAGGLVAVAMVSLPVCIGACIDWKRQKAKRHGARIAIAAFACVVSIVGAVLFVSAGVDFIRYW